jgi:hypothetical protein
VERSTRAVGKSLHAVRVVAREPLVQLLPAHAKAVGELRQRVQTGEIRLDEAAFALSQDR